jgi:chaperonin cofactor prefoldin
MSYRDLVDVALTVDTSGLQGTLERIDNNVEILQGKINEIVTLTEEDVQTLIRDALGDGSPGVEALGDLVQRVSELEKTEWTEDTLHDEIASYISAENIMDSDDVDRAIDDKLDGYVSTDDLDQNIQDKLDENNYVTENDVREMAHNEGVLQEDSAPFTELVSSVEALEVRVEALENDEVGNQVGTLGTELKRLTEDFDVHIKSLEEQVKAQDSAIDALQMQVETLTLKMGETLERSDTALTFFGLIKQAFALLQRGS